MWAAKNNIYTVEKIANSTYTCERVESPYFNVNAVQSLLNMCVAMRNGLFHYLIIYEMVSRGYREYVPGVGGGGGGGGVVI